MSEAKCSVIKEMLFGSVWVHAPTKHPVFVTLKQV